jgi:hypothetical protein
MQRTVEFPSPDAAWQFSLDASAAGWEVVFPEAAVARILTRPMALSAVIGILLGGILLGSVGWLADAGIIGLDRLEPILASPYGSVTLLFFTVGAGAGGLFGTIVSLSPAERREDGREGRVIVKGTGDKSVLERLVGRYGGVFAKPPDADDEGSAEER